jgi:hypothetical protein
MTKPINYFYEVYAPKAKDEQRFVDKHVVIKHKDRNGNDDDLFNAKNIKTIKRDKEGHGYDSGKDEKVYEETDENERYVGKYSYQDRSGKYVNARVSKHPEGGYQVHWADGSRGRKSAADMAKMNLIPEETDEDFEEAYNKDAVDQSIKSSRQKIGGKEAKMIHALLKGRDRNKEETKRTFPNVKHFTQDGHPDWKKHGVEEEFDIDEENLDELSSQTYRNAADKRLDQYDSLKQHVSDNRNKLGGKTREKYDQAIDTLRQKSNKLAGKAHSREREETIKNVPNKLGIGGSMGKKLGNLDKSYSTASRFNKNVYENENLNELSPQTYRNAAEKRWTQSQDVTQFVAKHDNKLGGKDKLKYTQAADALRAKSGKLSGKANARDREEMIKNAPKELGIGGSMGKRLSKIGMKESIIDESSSLSNEEFRNKARKHFAKVDPDYKTTTTKTGETIHHVLGKSVYFTKSGPDYVAVIKHKDNSPSSIATSYSSLTKTFKQHTNESIIDRALANFVPEINDQEQLSDAERLISLLDSTLSENNIHTLLGLFESLSEDNRIKMLMLAEDQDGINELLDFAISLKERATEEDLQDHEPRKVQGVYGMKSKQFVKKFKNQTAQDKYFDHPDREGQYEIHHVQRDN